MTAPVTFTKITSASCDLTKEYGRDAHGTLTKSAVAHMTEGHAQVLTIDSLQALDGLLSRLASNEAITCGVPIVGDTALTTRAGVEFRPGAVARTNEAFHFPYGPALYPIDVDVDGDEFPSVDAVLDALEACSPWLRNIYRVARPSSSSFVGKYGLRGVHVYIAVTHGTDIPALAKRMQIEQWAAGCGSVKISKSGALLTRQLSDDLVYQPSRLMFEANPVLKDGVTRSVPADQAFVPRAPAVLAGQPVKYKAEGGMLDVQALPAMREIETRRFETAKRDAKNARRREAKRVAIDYQIAQATASGFDAKIGERFGLLATRALGDKCLPPSWEIAVKDIGRVKVADILANLESALGHQCADPFDTWRPDLAPKHFGKAEIVMMGDKAGVWSHKLQTFFEFTNDVAADLTSPLDQAAEKLCDLIEYPEPLGKSGASELNAAHALGMLLRDAGIPLRHNLATSTPETADVPDALSLKYALARVGCVRVGTTTLEHAIGDVAKRNPYDPWRDAVQALPAWDKTPRLDTFFVDVMHAADSEAIRVTGQLLFAGIVMRQLQPGAALPVVPVLIGTQGCGKSRFVEDLTASLGFPATSALDFGDPIKMTMEARMSPVVELGEMANLGKRDVEEVKGWITKTVDRYRAPYDRRPEDHLRRFVLIGTSNKNMVNFDETGNRRFMPVTVPEGVSIDRGWLVEAKQFFAEAKARFCDDLDAYTQLVHATVGAVSAHNAAGMKRGEGTPQTVVSEFAPPIVQQLARQNVRRRVFVSELLKQIAASSPATRALTPRQVGAWMTMNGWASGTSNGMTYYTVPANYLAEGDEQPATDSPFNKPALAIVN